MLYNPVSWRFSAVTATPPIARERQASRSLRASPRSPLAVTVSPIQPVRFENGLTAVEIPVPIGDVTVLNPRRTSFAGPPATASAMITTTTNAASVRRRRRMTLRCGKARSVGNRARSGGRCEARCGAAAGRHAAEGVDAGEAHPARVGREPVEDLLLGRARRRAAVGLGAARRASGTPGRRRAGRRSAPARAAPGRRSSRSRSPGSRAGGRHARSWSSLQRSMRPAATSRATFTSDSARPALRSKDCSSAGAVPASVAARTAGRATSGSRPRTAPQRPSRHTIWRSIAAARSYSISCSQIAHASASNGSTRRVTRRCGRDRTDAPISGSSRNRS